MVSRQDTSEAGHDLARRRETFQLHEVSLYDSDVDHSKNPSAEASTDEIILTVRDDWLDIRYVRKKRMFLLVDGKLPRESGGQQAVQPKIENEALGPERTRVFQKFIPY